MRTSMYSFFRRFILQTLWAVFITGFVMLGFAACSGGKGTIQDIDVKERLGLLSSAEQEKITSEMAFIEGGEFQMGSDGDDIDEVPMHAVTVGDFYMDKTPVTIGAFGAFVKESGYVPTAQEQGFAWVFMYNHWEQVEGAGWDYYSGEGDKPSDFNSHPVTMVSWFDAHAFCTHYKKRLPSEAEWEYAAGGPEHTRFPLGNTFEPENYSAGLEGTVAVAIHPANGFGLYDMAGGVWEWTNTWYSYYPYTTNDGRENMDPPEGMEKKVPRGASYANFADDDRVFRCANRSTNGDVDNCYQNIGFRCAF